MLHLPAPNPYAFALSALDVLFTKEELSSSLLFKSKKSKKPPLDHRKVQILLSKYTSYCAVNRAHNHPHASSFPELMDKKFGDTWDLKTLKAKVNQKCRDSKPCSN